MATRIRVVKTYTNDTLSGAPIIVKLDATSSYCYAKFYPTITSASGESLDIFTTALAGYADSAISGVKVAAQIISNGIAYYLPAYTVIGTETLSYAGEVPAISIQSGVYLSGTPRIAEVTINGTPYYTKVYPSMVTAGIFELTKSVVATESDYISIISDPAYGTFPTITRNGELEASVYSPSSFELTGAVATHEAAYDHSQIANGQTAYGWGDHAGLYSLLAHDHSGVYSPVAHTHTGVYAAYSHTHTGVYSAYGHSHGSTYALSGHSHTNVPTSFGIGDIASSGSIFDVASVASASGGIGNGAYIRSVLYAAANDDYIAALRLYPTGIFGSYTGCTYMGIAIPNLITSGTPRYKQAITIDPQTGGTGNWGIVDYNNAYFGGNVSALSFTDRTPMFNGDALDSIKRIKGEKKERGLIDHSTLPAFARVRVKGTKKSAEYDGRDIGAMVSVLTVGIQQLVERVEELENKWNS
jgi:hypothetical protein